MFVGLEGRDQGMVKGLALARNVKHPDAGWLCSLFPSDASAPARTLEACDVFLQQGQDDARALCFAGLVYEDRWTGYEERMALVTRSAELGYAYA